MRARYLKPGFFNSVDLAKCRLAARYFYEGLWCFSDNLGRFKWEPKRIEAAVFPYEVGKYPIDELFVELIITHHVVPYPGENGTWYGYVPSSNQHFPDETKRRAGRVGSKLPDPPGGKVDLKALILSVFGKFPRIPKNSSLSYDSIDSIDSIDRVDVVTPPNPHGGLASAHETQTKTYTPGKTKPYPELFEMVISDLNAVAGTNYSSKTALTREKIQARWNEGFDLGDFRHVHRVKFAQWGSDPKRREFVRPPTLYSRKFESYRNQKMPHPMKGKVSDITLRSMEATEGWENG